MDIFKNTILLNKGYIQRTNPFADGYVQDSNPFADGYIQDTNPLADVRLIFAFMFRIKVFLDLKIKGLHLLGDDILKICQCNYKR